MKVAIGADHAGYELKETVKELLSARKIETDDLGTTDTESTDYPDYAQKVAASVSSGNADFGVLVCSTGIGMSMAANKFCNVRAALCASTNMAHMARLHNNANILVLGQKETNPETAEKILDEWLSTDFEEGGRHSRRISKMSVCSAECLVPENLALQDPEIGKAIDDEIHRQQNAINLIASENSVSKAVIEAQGSVMTNKYAEGYPGKRWYNGCDYVDTAEQLAIDRALELFGGDHANVQPHCGSSANMAAYFSVLEPGDTVMAMSLAHGGHLTHGHSINFSGRLFNFVPYGVSETDEYLDYDELEKMALENKPKMIVVGASAYSRILDFERFRAIADKVGAYLMVDMAHIAGLVAAGVHPNPVPHSHFVTTTTHKTLRGPRGGMVICKEEFAAELDKQVFPGLQGGPLMHVIAAKAVCFREALQPSFKSYGEQVVKNAQIMAKTFSDAGIKIVSDGTDNHLMLLNLSSMDVTGKDAALALDQAGIIVNKNSIPFDTKSPFVTSGIRIGTPTITSRGMKEAEASEIASLVIDVLNNMSDESVIQSTRTKVMSLTERFTSM